MVVMVEGGGEAGGDDGGGNGGGGNVVVSDSVRHYVVINTGVGFCSVGVMEVIMLRLVLCYVQW